MKRSRWRTFIVGTVLGVLYGLLFNLLLSTRDVLISNTYIFLIPFIIGGIPAIFSTKEQLKNYKDFILIPWISIFSFFAIAFALKMEGTICLVLILFPFFLLGTLGAFIYRAIRIKQKGNGTKLYFSLLLPLLMISGESLLKEED